MNPPPLPRSRRVLPAALALLVVVAAAAGVWWWMRPVVPPADVEAFLNRTAGGDRFRFTADKIGTIRQGEGELQLTVDATAHVLLPLYQAVDTADYLEHTLGVDVAATAEGRRLLALPRTGATSDIRPPDPYKFTLLQPRLPADATLTYQGVVAARRKEGRWALSLVSGGFTGGPPVGEVRSSFPDPTLVLGVDADDRRLQAMATDFKTFGAKVDSDRINRERAHAEAVEGRRRSFLVRIAPGSILGGLGREAGEQRGTPLYLQITGLSPDQSVTALLRNDGSWRRARAFAGSWSADDDFLAPVLTLTSLPDQAVNNAGPFLENAQSWTLTLREDEHGILAEQTPLFQYRFERLGGSQISALQAQLDAEMTAALAATEPGRLYEGTAIARATGASEPVLLKFTARSPDTGALDVVLTSSSHSWARPLHGGVIANSRRSGGEPIRLRSAAADAAADAGTDSPLGTKDDIDLHLGSDGPALVGEDAVFTYRFVPTTAEDQRRQAEQKALRVHELLNVLRPGMALDGTLHEDQGFVVHARLQIDTVDPVTGAMTGSLHSLTKVKVYREFAGAIDPSGDSVVLATGRGNLDSSGDFNAPFLLNSTPAKIRLAVTGTDLNGRIEGDPHWTFNFPVAFVLAQPLESLDPKGPAADGGVFPAFPKAEGAYLLSHGAWVPLPTNNAHTVVETIKPKADVQLPTNIIDLIAQGMSEIDRERKKVKITYLIFDGKEAVPEPSSPGLTILAVGRSAGHLPLAEIGAAQTTKEGVRKVAVGGATPEKMHFGIERAPAYVRPAGPGNILLTTTELLGDGAYVFIAEHAYELEQK